MPGALWPPTHAASVELWVGRVSDSRKHGSAALVWKRSGTGFQPWAVHDKRTTRRSGPSATHLPEPAVLMCLRLDVRGERWNDAVVLHRSEDFRGG